MIETVFLFEFDSLAGVIDFELNGQVVAYFCRIRGCGHRLPRNCSWC